ncbi:MAG: hypothetical protein IPG83_14215 [Novosphingobium sp.]|nr:hypothetical protein [Novosphingobium sp.]
MITQHAQARMQSRSIPVEAIDALLTFGVTRRHRGQISTFSTAVRRSRTQRSLERNSRSGSSKMPRRLCCGRRWWRHYHRCTAITA